MGAQMGGKGKNGTVTPKSKLGIFAILFTTLGWVLAVLLFYFVYLAVAEAEIFCRAGGGRGVASIFTFPAAASPMSSNASHTSVAETLERMYQPESFSGSDSQYEYPSYCNFGAVSRFLSEVHLLRCAFLVGRQRTLNATVQGPQRVAFMFVTRGWNRHERLWKRFFDGHQDKYSLYAHTNPNFKYLNTSIFYQHQVPSRIVKRFHINVVDAMRRTLAYAILDPEYGSSNSWFVFLCESSVPIRGFDFTYKYLTESKQSFVESFKPEPEYRHWDGEPFFGREELRKGELWMALQLRHAVMVLDDWDVYYIFKKHCNSWCTPDEQYIQTLLHIRDPTGIENRTVMYVNWTGSHGGSPHTYVASDMPVEWFKELQTRSVDRDGEYHDTSDVAQFSTPWRQASRICHYNGAPDAPCFLFARKINGDSVRYIDSLPVDVLGY